MCGPRCSRRAVQRRARPHADPRGVRAVPRPVRRGGLEEGRAPARAGSEDQRSREEERAFDDAHLRAASAEPTDAHTFVYIRTNELDTIAAKSNTVEHPPCMKVPPCPAFSANNPTRVGHYQYPSLLWPRRFLKSRIENIEQTFLKTSETSI